MQAKKEWLYILILGIIIVINLLNIDSTIQAVVSIVGFVAVLLIKFGLKNNHNSNN